MIFGNKEEEDWKDLLCGSAQAELAELIERTKQHRAAYMQAEDVKVAQLWCALTEMSRQMKKLEERVVKAEAGMKGMAELGNVAKRQALREKIGDFMGAKTRDEKEQVEKIVDVLMEF